MKIVYNPSYDQEVFLSEGTTLMGTIYVGSLGLLQQLELLAAIPTTIKSDVQREVDYLNAMQKHIVGTIFEQAASVDDLGVAGKLMHWRDSLIMAGWDGQCANRNATKLYVLAQIENDFNSYGNADRWRKVYRTYSSHPISTNIHIQVNCPWSEVPFIIQKTLDSLQANGCTVEKLVCNEPGSLNLDKLQILEFSDLNDAYEWISTVEEFPKNTLVINRDNTRLNHTLFSWDKPLTGASLRDSNPQIIQMFKLSMSIFSRPLNIQNLVSYLLLPMSPIPKALGRKLAQQLIKDGGFGESKLREDGIKRDEWSEIIENFEFLNKDNKPTSQAKAKKMPFLTPIREVFTTGIDKNKLKEYVGEVLKWINGIIGADESLTEGIKSQLHELKALYNSFDTALQSFTDSIISFSEIDKLVKRIYRPMNYSVQCTEKGAMHVVTDIEQMACPADNLIWLDCQNENQENDPFDFLSISERNYLSDQGVILPDFAEHLNTIRNERLRLLNSVKNRIILVKSAYDGTTRLSEHAIIAEAKSECRKKGVELPIASPTTIDIKQTIGFTNGNVEKFEPVESYELGPVSYSGRKESNHSLDTLINYPFDYVVKYLAGLYLPDEDQVSNVYITLGLVAHNFFEHIIDDAGQDLAKMRELVDGQFEQRLNSAIDATGLILRLSENAAELDSFSKHLKDSMLALIKIMEMLKLKPVGCEMEFPEEGKKLNIQTIGDFGARIDFLMTNENGEYVIFDFKWSYSSSYETKLEKNLAIQLELYRQTILAIYPDKKVHGVGYYLMPRKQLLTTDFESNHRMIKHIEPSTTNLFAQIQHSYTYRMEEIRRGHIEEGEEINIMEITNNYYSKQAEKGLCPLDVKEKTEGRGKAKCTISIKKGSNKVFRPSKKPKFENAELEPSEIETKNQILKNRLK